MARKKNAIQGVGSWTAERLADQSAGYEAARDNSRFRRRRNFAASGSHGDYHVSQSDYLRVVEYARAIDRDDCIVGSILDRAEINTIQGGFQLDIDLGDITLDQELLGGWHEWSDDARRCDYDGELDFAEMESMAFRAALADGDIWAMLTDDDQIQWFENHRIRTPSDAPSYVFNGIEMYEGTRRQRRVWICEEGTGPRATPNSGKFTSRDVFDDEAGLRRMLQVYVGSKRISLARGMSVYQKLFDLVGMHDDTEFAGILKQQLQNALVFTETQTKESPPGPEQNLGPVEQVSQPDGTTEQIEGIGAGTVVRSRTGKELKPFMSTAPGPDFISHLRHILMLMGVNLGMPLVMVLMDAKETNFSGWRGAFDQAKLGFRRNQRRMIKRFHDPVLDWHLARRMAANASLRQRFERMVAKAREKGRVWRKWHCPTWPYVNPAEDRAANLVAVANYQESPSTNMAAQGQDYYREMPRAIEDREAAIEWAMAAADRLRKKYQSIEPSFQVSWQDLYMPPAPKHVTVSISANRDANESSKSGTAGPGGDK